MAKKNRGTNLVQNPFKKAMLSSVDNAGTISGTVMNNLNLKKGTDSRIMDAYNYYLPFDTAVQNTVVALRQAINEKLTSTKVIQLTEKGFALRLHAIFIGVEGVYVKHSSNYDRLLIGGAESFESVTRNLQKDRLIALETAIGSDVSLTAVKALVTSLKNDVISGISGQQSEIMNVSTDSASVKTVVSNATTALWVVYFMLMIIFIANVSLAIAYFPMTFIYKAAKQMIKTVYVPKATIKKILSHLFKIGETFTAKNNGTVDLWIGLAETSTSDVLVWYLLPAGATVTDIAYSLLGNPTFKFVMTKNASLTTAGDLTFTVNGI